MYKCDDMRFRIWMVAGLIVCALLGVAGKISYLHLHNHSKMAGREFTRPLLGLRGGIYPRGGKTYPMASSLPAYLYFIDPTSVNWKKGHDPRQIAKVTSEALGMDEETVFSKFWALNKQGETNRYNRLGVSFDNDVFAALSTNTISGIGIEKVAIRNYPQKHRMSHVLGFVNDLGGGSGVEQYYDRYLKGTDGKIQGVPDAGRREIYVKRKVHSPSIQGCDIFLTLDHNIQYEVERELREVVEAFTALSGWAIVQHVKTGEILAMASYPDFEPGRYGAFSGDNWINKALVSVYEPGSIMKAVTVAAAMNERLVTPETMIEVGYGPWLYAGKLLNDHVTKHAPNGYISVRLALEHSSNIACAKLGLMLGEKRFVNYLQAFNFGSPLNIDLPREEHGILPRPGTRMWDKLKIVRMPIGHGVAVTGLQMISAYSTLANDGVAMRPYVVDRIISASGEEVFKNKPEVLGRPVRPEVARAVRDMLQGVTEEGTGTRASIPGYTVAGKTGTAQKAIRGGYSNVDYYASFVGMVPASEPVFTVLVTVECPKPQHSGGFVAAPVFSKIAMATARYLEVEPDMTLEATAK